MESECEQNKTKRDNNNTTKHKTTKLLHENRPTPTELNICWCGHNSGSTVLGTDLMMFTKHVLGGRKGQRSSGASKRVHLNIINLRRISSTDLKGNILPRLTLRGHNGKDMLTHLGTKTEKFYKGRVRPEIQPLTLYVFQKDTPFVHLLSMKKNGTPFTYLQ